MKASYITPAITLFHEDGSFDFESQEALYENLIRNHMDGILVQGSIGEFFAMSLEQRKELARFSVGAIRHRTRVIIGTGSMNPEEIIPYSDYCLELGADAVMIIPPWYFRFDDDALFRFFDRFASAIHGPLYIYNFPDRTGYTIAPETVLRLALKHPNIIGIKDTISGLDHTRELIKAIKPQIPDFEIYSGFDDNAAHNVLSGGNGCIGGISNVVPEVCAAWIQAMRSDDTAGIAAGQQLINRLMDIYFVGSLFVPIIKEGARLRKIVSANACTFPMPEVTPEQSQKIQAILKRENLLL